jgi:hypothetical protein
MSQWPTNPTPESPPSSPSSSWASVSNWRSLFADLKETPSEAAINFLQAYYKLDADLGDRVCEDRKVVDDVDVVDAYLYTANQRGRPDGIRQGWKQRKLGQIKSKPSRWTPKSASFHVTAQARMEINPLFSWLPASSRSETAIPWKHGGPDP